MAKILLHSLIFPPDATANAYIFADLARELKKLGHEVVVLTTTPHYSVIPEALKAQPMKPVRGDWLLKSDFEGMECYHVRVSPEKGGILKRIKTALRFNLLGFRAAAGPAFKCDVVLSQSPPLTVGLMSALIAKKHGAKSIFVVQDIFPDGSIHLGKIKNRFFIRLLRLLEQQVYRRSDAITSLSTGLVDILRERVPEKTLLREIPNFVNTDLYRVLPRQNEYSAARGLDDKFVVSYVGNVGHYQDFEPLFAAADACRDIPVKFLVAGNGVLLEGLKKRALAEGLTGIEFLGYQEREVTPWINASSDLCLVLLSPLVGNYSFPSKVYTIMACARPTLVYGGAASDIVALVRDGGAGWAVTSGNPADFAAKIRELYNDREALEKCGSRAREMVEERFTASAVASRYSELIAELTGGK